MYKETQRPRLTKTVLNNQNKAGFEPQHRISIQGDCNQDSLVLAQKQTRGSVKQNRNPRNEPAHPWLTIF